MSTFIAGWLRTYASPGRLVVESLTVLVQAVSRSSNSDSANSSRGLALEAILRLHLLLLLILTQAMASLKQVQALVGGPLIQARNFAVMTGVNAGISRVLKRIRGKEDVQASMAAALGSGVLFSLVSGMGSPNLAASVITSGIFFTLVQGGIFSLGQKFSTPPEEDLFYARTKNMLSSLGLQQYENNFRRAC